MKRIAFLVCGLLLVATSQVEARGRRWNNNQTYYTLPAQTATVAYRPVVNTPAATPSATAAAETTTSSTTASETSEVATAAATTALPVTSAPARTVSYSTATAQGVANLMAAYSRVGHWGGNPGYEGCGCGATPAAAYAICCYANSGMATVDVGYAQGANGMWYCCRRYR